MDGRHVCQFCGKGTGFPGDVPRESCCGVPDNEQLIKQDVKEGKTMYERRLCSNCGEGLGFSESDPCDLCGGLTRVQLSRQDFVDNHILVMLSALSGSVINYADPGVSETIGHIRDMAQDLICEQLEKMTEMDFYPFLEEEDE